MTYDVLTEHWCIRTLVPRTVTPEKREFEIAKFFAAMGKDIVFLKPSNNPKMHTPDIRMDGVEWEMKCSTGDSKRTIETNFRKAVLQSKYIIFDLRRIKVPEKLCFFQLEKEFNVRKYLKRMYVIRKNGELKLLFTVKNSW